MHQENPQSDRLYQSFYLGRFDLTKNSKNLHDGFSKEISRKIEPH